MWTACNEKYSEGTLDVDCL